MSRNIRTDIPALLKCHYQIVAVKPTIRTITPRPYPISPITLGDYLRKTRLDLNLTQNEVATDIFKTSVQNIRNWEANRSQISLRFRPTINEFIGFCPCDVSLLVGLRLKERRENFGLTVKKLAKFLNVDSCTVAYWERCEHQPSQKSLKIIEGFLKSFSPKKLIVRDSESITSKDFLKKLPFPNFVLYEAKWAVGHKITVWRISTGLSQRKLAKLSGVCFQSICRWEKEQRLPEPEHQKLILKTIILYLESII